MKTVGGRESLAFISSPGLRDVEIGPSAQLCEWQGEVLLLYLVANMEPPLRQLDGVRK